MKKIAAIVALVAALTAFSAAPSLATSGLVEAMPNHFPDQPFKPQFPGMTAKIKMTSGSATIIVLHKSRVVVDGVTFDIGDHQKLSVDVRNEATVVTGTHITLEVNGAGTYTDFRGIQTVTFQDTGTINQDSYKSVRFFRAGNFTAANWTAVEVHSDIVLHTTDVRDVVAFGNSDVTVTNCWIASSFSSIPMRTTGCRFPQGNVVK